MSKGICVAGNLIVDVIYPTKGWPRQGELVHIADGISRVTGGAVCNVGIDLAKLDPEMPVYAVGQIGVDAEGDLVLETMGAHPNIDLSRIRREGITGHTLVMNDLNTSERTFFTYCGANGSFDVDSVDWDSLPGDLFHIGYILLLDALDRDDVEYGTRMARLLHTAQKKGFRTSVDVVSESGDRFRRIVPPALRYTDYCVINELEAQQTTGVMLRDESGLLHPENMPEALRAMKSLGVSTWAVIHCPEGGYGLDESDRYVEMRSLNLPEGYIRGTVGAGDAFCAGVLLGAEKGYALERAIELGIASAAASLSDASSTGGMKSECEVMRLNDVFGRR